MTWRPLDHIPDPLRLALCDAVRALVLEHDVGRGIRRDGDGLLIVPVPDGQEVRVGLRPTARAPVPFGPRQAIRYDFDGHAAQGRMSYGLSAHATLDVKTKSFVDVGCDILWQARA